MRLVRVRNLTSKKEVFERAFMTENFGERLIGLMFKRPPLDFEALIIDRCDSVHTFFMRFDLDLVFLSREKSVLNIIKGLRPFRFSGFVKDSYYVIEIPSGCDLDSLFSAGDQIEIY